MHWPTICSVIAFPVIVVACTMLARKEERRMLAEHGNEYRDYQRRVPDRNRTSPRSLERGT